MVPRELLATTNKKNYWFEWRETNNRLLNYSNELEKLTIELIWATTFQMWWEQARWELGIAVRIDATTYQINCVLICKTLTLSINNLKIK